MTIRLYIDEDSMDNDLVRALRARGMEVTTAQVEGMIEQRAAKTTQNTPKYGKHSRVP